MEDVVTKIGDYKVTISPKIGSGSYGQVYRAEHETTKELRAVKQIDLMQNMKQNDKLLQRAQKELNIIRRLQDHENIVKLFDVISLPSSVWIFMEFCSHNNLTYYIQENVEMDLLSRLEIFRQCASALFFMHCQKPKIIHRDIKMENILMTESDGRIVSKLTDFGLSKFIENQSTSQIQMKTFTGTRYYMAPELFEGQTYTENVDVFALGLVFSVLLQYGPNHLLTIPLSGL